MYSASDWLVLVAFVGNISNMDFIKFRIKFRNNKPFLCKEEVLDHLLELIRTRKKNKCCVYVFVECNLLFCSYRSQYKVNHTIILRDHTSVLLLFGSLNTL